tara:strand:- start:1805 stop:2422 length:618 start_codon:yes stop_codon:yes gene_type:complete
LQNRKDSKHQSLINPLITIASGNAKKVAEIEAMLGPLPVEIRRQPNDLNVEETGNTYLDNALLKGIAAAKRTNSWTISDDSGLEVDALKGAPGIYSARFAPSKQEKLTKLLEAIGRTPYRSARFHSVMVLCSPKGIPVANAEGICWGEILESPAYQGGEFESLFWVKESQCTYGELSEAQLSKIGSRGKAARIIAPTLLTCLEIN